VSEHLARIDTRAEQLRMEAIARDPFAREGFIDVALVAIAGEMISMEAILENAAGEG